MTHPRGLSEDEADAWDRLADTVAPLDPKSRAKVGGLSTALEANGIVKVARPPVPFVSSAVETPRRQAPLPVTRATPIPAPIRSNQLDGSWNRKIKSGQIEPDFNLDLHGHTLDEAYTRLMRGMKQASAMGARVILVVTGKSRPVDSADRGTSRGAIRAKILDWLAASEHGGRIAAVRKAHRKHGGDGALYLVLRRG